MRLGTLARKISITPSKLTAFLESQNTDLTSGTNTKLSEEEIEIVLNHFNATLAVEINEEENITSTVEEVEEVLVTENAEEIADKIEEENTSIENKEAEVEIVEKEITSKISESFSEIALPHELEDTSNLDVAADKEIDQNVETEEEEYIPQIPDDLDPEIESHVERMAYDQNVKVIKPVKVKLQGLKVKGKIDLPEPKVKEEAPEEAKNEDKKAYDPDEIITTTGPKRDRRRKPKNYKGKKFDKDYNPIEAERKKKAWEEKKKKEQEEKRKKKAKELHYKKTVKASTSSTSTKKKSKKITTKQKQEQQPAGNVFQRFWRWMNT